MNTIHERYNSEPQRMELIRKEKILTEIFICKTSSTATGCYSQYLVNILQIHSWFSMSVQRTSKFARLYIKRQCNTGESSGMMVYYLSTSCYYYMAVLCIS